MPLPALYRIERIATASHEARYCRCCGAEGEYDEQGLYALADDLFGSGRIDASEHDNVSGAETDGEAFEAYEDIRARHAEADDELPSIPMEYIHEPDCEAMMLYRAFGAFGDVFGTYVDVKYGHANDVADFSDGDEEFV